MATVNEFFHTHGNVVSELQFIGTTFNEGVLIENISGNKSLKFVNCNFEKEVTLCGFINDTIFINECNFKDKLNVRDVKTGGLNLELNSFNIAEFKNFETDLILYKENKIQGYLPLQFVQSQIKSLRIYDNQQ